jgi:hypothetical protein
MSCPAQVAQLCSRTSCLNCRGVDRQDTEEGAPHSAHIWRSVFGRVSINSLCRGRGRRSRCRAVLLDDAENRLGVLGMAVVRNCFPGVEDERDVALVLWRRPAHATWNPPSTGFRPLRVPAVRSGVQPGAIPEATGDTQRDSRGHGVRYGTVTMVRVYSAAERPGCTRCTRCTRGAPWSEWRTVNTLTRWPWCTRGQAAHGAQWSRCTGGAQ